MNDTMAAKASKVLKEMADAHNRILHGFGFAPGMDAPYLDNEVWGKAYQALKETQDNLQSLLGDALRGEESIDNPDTAEACAKAWLDKKYFDYVNAP